MSRYRKIIFIFFAAIFFVLVINTFVLAQKELEISYPEVPGAEKPTMSAGSRDVFPNYIKYIFNFGIALSGLIAFVSLIYGGVRYLTSGGSPAATKDARGRIFSAVLGLLVLLGSYLVLTTINPQLTIFSISLPEKCDCSKPTAELTSRCQNICQKGSGEDSGGEDKTITAQEIPVAGLMEDMLSKTRLDRIKLYSEETKKAAEKVKTIAEGLELLVKNCDCAISATGSCQPGNCQQTDCTSDCQISNDPCGSSRPAVENKRKALTTALSGLEKDKGLAYWQAKLERELVGSSADEFIGIKKEFQDLTDMRESINKCPPQMLLNSDNFWEYKEAMTSPQTKIIKDIKRVEPWGYIKAVNDQATFFCTEAVVDVSLVKAPAEGLFIGKIPEEEEEKTEVGCQEEIPMMQIVNWAEDLAQKIIIRVDDINENAKKIIAAAEGLYYSTDQDCSDGQCCSLNNCSADMSTTELGGCGDCGQDTEECEDVCDKEGKNCQKKCQMVHYYEPCYYYCDSCSCLGVGQACPFSIINQQATQMAGSLQAINNSFDELKKYLEEKDIPKEIKKTEIFKKLAEARAGLKECWNTAEEWLEVLNPLPEERTKNILIKSLWRCSETKVISSILTEDCRARVSQCSQEGNYFCTINESR